MRYLVILKDGTILCNVAELDRAMNICLRYAGSFLVTTKWKMIFRNVHAPSEQMIVYEH